MDFYDFELIISRDFILFTILLIFKCPHLWSLTPHNHFNVKKSAFVVADADIPTYHRLWLLCFFLSFEEMISQHAAPSPFRNYQFASALRAEQNQNKKSIVCYLILYIGDL